MSETPDQKAERLINALIDEGFNVEDFMRSLEDMGRAWADAYGVDYGTLDETKMEEKK